MKLSTVQSYTVMMVQLQIEGRPDEELDALLHEMRGLGIEPDARVREVRALPEANLARMRTTELRELLKGKTKSRTAAAWAIFDGL